MNNEISEYCIYTMRKRDNLRSIFMSGGSGEFIENKNWKTGFSLLIQAKENNVKMPIIFSAADENSGLIYLAFLESIDVNAQYTETKYTFSNLTEIKKPKPLSSLILKSSGEPLSNNHIRPYAICCTPQFLANWGQENGLASDPKCRKTGSEKFHLNGKKLDFSLLNFWKWSASDIVGNSLRGILAEFIVAKSLNLADDVRSTWDVYDLWLPNGIRIEVKSAAYIQSWYQKELSEISFDIHKTRDWNEQTNFLTMVSKRQADIYVFCLLKHTDKETIDPLNIDQWEFYILPASLLNAKFGEQKQISLKSLKKVEPNPVGYKELPYRIEMTQIIEGFKH